MQKIKGLNTWLRFEIYNNDRRIYDDDENLDKVRFYKFHLSLTESLKFENLFEENNDFETGEYFSLIIEVNLSNYMLEKISNLSGCDDDEGLGTFVNKSFDVLSILEKFRPHLLKFHLERLIRKKGSLILEPLYNKDSNVYWGTSEIIELDDKSSFYGNFEIGGKNYARVRSFTNESKLVTKFDIKKDFSWYDLPDSIRSSFTNEDTPNWNTLDSKSKTLITRKYLESHLSYLDTNVCTHHLQIHGNDDDSWTKSFYSKEDLNTELAFLRKMQPINKDFDVISKGYYFTN